MLVYSRSVFIASFKKIADKTNMRRSSLKFPNTIINMIYDDFDLVQNKTKRNYFTQQYTVILYSHLHARHKNFPQSQVHGRVDARMEC